MKFRFGGGNETVICSLYFAQIKIIDDKTGQQHAVIDWKIAALGIWSIAMPFLTSDDKTWHTQKGNSPLNRQSSDIPIDFALSRESKSFGEMLPDYALTRPLRSRKSVIKIYIFLFTGEKKCVGENLIVTTRSVWRSRDLIQGLMLQ